MFEYEVGIFGENSVSSLMGISPLKLSLVCLQLNHSLPQKIIVYRDGVGDGQLKVVQEHEVEQIASSFAHFGEAYQPKMAYIVVQKRINTRVFSLNVSRLEIFYSMLG